MILELHLTYRCNLACHYCNRGCRLRTDHTPDITLEQWEHVVRTCPNPTIVILIGGEPTIREDIFDFIDLTKKLKPSIIFSLYSNAYSEQSRHVLQKLKSEYGIKNTGGTEKTSGSILQQMQDIFISPKDCGWKRTTPCNWAAIFGQCGYSVDGGGITTCSIGGMIDGMLGLGVRTWDWNQVNWQQLVKLCAHCGCGVTSTGAKTAELYDYRGQKMTKEWYDACTK